MGWEAAKIEDIPRGNFNKLLFHPSFKRTIDEINDLNIQLPPRPSPEEMDFGLYTFPPNGMLISNVEEIKSYRLDSDKGREFITGGRPISAYDESVNKFAGLEGVAYLTSHALVMHGEKDFIPSSFLTFYFYTRSKKLTKEAKFIKYSEDPENQSKKDYVIDRTDFIINNTPTNSIVLIDGPLIGGQVSDLTIKLNNELLKKNAIPLFFVKNSTSNLVTDNINELKGRYNSDMHWAYKTLRKGERSNLFKYVDQHNPRNAKLFCYLKAFDLSPQRVEFHVSTFEKHKDKIGGLMDLVYYLMLVQGNLKNPQVRSIAIAEKYARASLKLINLDKLMKKLGVMPTMNQERFGW